MMRITIDAVEQHNGRWRVSQARRQVQQTTQAAMALSGAERAAQMRQRLGLDREPA